MKLKLDFVTKVPKVAKDNQVILLNNKNTQNKEKKFRHRPQQGTPATQPVSHPLRLALPMPYTNDPSNSTVQTRVPSIHSTTTPNRTRNTDTPPPEATP